MKQWWDNTLPARFPQFHDVHIEFDFIAIARGRTQKARKKVSEPEMVKPCLNVWTGFLIVCILLVASCTPASRVTPSVTTVNMPVTPTPTVTPILPKQSNSRDSIVFQSFRNGEEAIYSMGGNGMGQIRLVNGVDPAWSPDGKRLAYSQIVDDSEVNLTPSS